MKRYAVGFIAGLTFLSLAYAAVSRFDIVDAVTGYRVNGAAASGTLLVGNGTNYVPATPLPTLAVPTPVPTATAAPTPIPDFGSSPGTKHVTTSLGADPSTDNCVKWIAGGKLGDAGAACGSGGGGSGSFAPYDEATPLPTRAAFNCVGSLIACSDDSGNSRTNITITAPTALPTATPQPTATPGVAAALTNSVRVKNSTTQSLTDSTLTALTFDTEDFDNGAMHSTSSNTSRLTAPSTGYYISTCSVGFAANSTGTRQVFIRKNGSTLLGSTETVAGADGGTTRITTATIINLSATDYLECIAYQTSGTGINTEVHTDLTPIFSAIQVQ